VLVSSTVNTYVADFRNTPLNDTQLFDGVTPSFGKEFQKF